MSNKDRYPNDQSFQDWEDQNRNRSNRKGFNQKEEDKNYGFYSQNSGANIGNSNAGGYNGQVARGREQESQGIYNDQNQYGNQQYGNQNRQVNYIPDNDDNHEYKDHDSQNNQYGTSGSYGYKGNADNYDKNGTYGNGGNYGNNYGTSGKYDDEYGFNQQQYNQGQYDGKSQKYKSDFEKHYHGQNKSHGNYVDGYKDNQQQPKNRYGGDTANYGNANQGGFDRDWWDRTRDEVASWFGDDDAERRRKRDKNNTNPNGYKGKGPKNYQRSEQRIREDVCDRLTEDDYLDASEIEVQVQGSEVVLTGNVTTRYQKRRAEDVVESIAGVVHVENRLRVNTTQSTNTGNTSVNDLT